LCSSILNKANARASRAIAVLAVKVKPLRDH
jgi:hypothetical protein